jgi:signal transduction histidine kinase
VGIKQLVVKNLKGLLEAGIVVCIIAFNISYLLRPALLINLATAFMALWGMAGIIVVCNHIKDKRNNKSNMIAIGYASLAILLIIKFYNDEYRVIFGESHNQIGLIIDLLEIAYIVIGIKCVNQYTSLKKYVYFSGVVLITGILLSYRIDILSVLPIASFYAIRTEVIIRTFLLGGTIIFLVDYCRSTSGFCKTNRYRVVFILILHSIYQIMYLALEWNGNVFGDIGLSVLKLIYYGNIFSFIYQETHYVIWGPMGEDLEGKTKKLKEDIKRKDILIIVAEKLQEYIQKIEDTNEKLKDKIQQQTDFKKLKYVYMITQNVYRLKKLTHNIRAINQIDSGRIKPQFTYVNIVQLMEQLIDSIESYFTSMHIHITLIKSKDNIYCYIDTELIERVMLNIISNAIKYNKDDGSIAIFINTKKDNVYICIQDTGVGIAAERIETVFNRFERGDTILDKVREGSGLGLPIVKSLIEMHQGTIYIVSKENYGTMVSICLPIHEEIQSEIFEYGNTNKGELEDKMKIEFSDLRITR